jgi:hypothetical protein
MSLTPGMKRATEWSEDDVQNYRMFRYRQGATVSQVNDELTRAREQDVDRLVQERAQSRYQAERTQATNTMAAEYQKAAAPGAAAFERTYMIKSESPFSVVVSPPDPYGFGTLAGRTSAPGTSPASQFDGLVQQPYGNK